MKNLFKLIGFITLAALIGFSMVACDDGGGGDPETFTVTVNGGSGSGSYEEGATVTITATVPEGKQFKDWTVDSGGVLLANINSQSTTFTMPANAVTVTANFSGGSNPNTSLDGVWVSSSTNNVKITVSGNSGIYNNFNFTDALWTSAIDKGYVKIGDQCWRNLTNTGNLKWSGQQIVVVYNTNNPNVATGMDWTNITITMSADGQTITVVTTSGTTYTYTRQ